MARRLPDWMKDSDDEDHQPLFLHLDNAAIHYHMNAEDCLHACKMIVEALPMTVGFDMEWPVRYGSGEQETALIQIYLKHNHSVHLFHVAAIGFLTEELGDLLADPRLTKVGVNIKGDMWKLGRDYGFPAAEVIEKSTVELRGMASRVLRSDGWGLDGLCQRLLDKRLDKAGGVRTGRWDSWPLSDSQVEYAALDAYASFLVFNELCNIERCRQRY